MRRTVTVLMVIGLILGAAIMAAAASETAALVKIPFAFHAGNQLMPAGEYRVEMPTFGNLATGAMVKITSLDYRLCMHLFSQPGFDRTAGDVRNVTFSKVGDQYFFAGVQIGVLGAEVSKSNSERMLERELATGAGEPAVIHLKAHATRSK